MDERDAMGGYYLHRGLGVAPGSIQQGGLHGPQSIRGMPNQNPNLGAQSHQIGGGGGSIGSGFGSDSTASVNMMGSSFAGHVEPEKKKRGRPRKYGPDGALALSPLSGSAGVSGSAAGVAGSGASGSGSGMAKRGRGRPPGSGKKQQLASHGEWIAGSAGTGFTPHVITIAVGEDIGNKLMSFSQQGPRTVCILSANGAVSSVTLRQNANYGGTVTYEGRFDIICLSGSYMPSDGGGSHSRSRGLSISLSKPDGRVFGGDIGGALIAATQVQVIVGSFLQSGSKSKDKSKSEQESSGNNGHEHQPMSGDRQSTPPMGTAPTQSITAQMMGGGWQVPRNNALDIDLTRG